MAPKKGGKESEEESGDNKDMDNESEENSLVQKRKSQRGKPVAVSKGKAKAQT